MLYTCARCDVEELKLFLQKQHFDRVGIFYLGRTEFDSAEVDNEVVVHSKSKLSIGEFYKVKITKAYDYDLEGEVEE